MAVVASGGGGRGGGAPRRRFLAPASVGAVRTRRVSGGTQGESYTEKRTEIVRPLSGPWAGKVTVATIIDTRVAGQRVFMVRDGLTGQLVSRHGTAREARRAALAYANRQPASRWP